MEIKSKKLKNSLGIGALAGGVALAVVALSKEKNRAKIKRIAEKIVSNLKKNKKLKTIRLNSKLLLKKAIKEVKVTPNVKNK